MHPQENYGRGSEIMINSDTTIKVRNGALELSMCRNIQNYPYVGGELISNNSFGYGIYECTANFATDKGSWAAFWLFGGGGEIDIAENKWFDSINVKIGNYIHRWEGGPLPTYSWTGNESSVYGNSTHVYKCIWNSTEIMFYTDGVLNFSNNPLLFIPINSQHIYISQQVQRDEGTGPDKFGTFKDYQTSYFYSVKYKEFFDIPIVNCPEIICSSSCATLSVDSRATNITWTLSPSNKFSLSSGSGFNANIVPSGTSFSGTITFSFMMPSVVSDEIFSVSKSFWVGKLVKPSNISFIPPTPCLNQIVIGTVTSANPESASLHYNWRNTHTYIDQNPSGSEVQFQTLNGNSGYTTSVYVSASNECGTSAEFSKLLSVNKCSGGGSASAIITPNPASTEIEIIIIDEEKTDESSKSKSSNNSAKYNISILDIDGASAFKDKMESKNKKINISDWRNGIYNVIITSKDKTINSRFIIEK